MNQADIEKIKLDLQSRYNELDMTAAKCITVLQQEIATLQNKVPKLGDNITEEDPSDQFICSECGTILEGYHRVEIDEDYGDKTNHEYRIRYCPDCGADVHSIDDFVEKINKMACDAFPDSYQLQIIERLRGKDNVHHEGKD